MGTIQRLPETVRNIVRSGVVLFDLTRVVEELVFNSLDAGATKVSVFVGVGTCYVKVVDNGSGISRDGLMLLGERYVTSKLQHLADMDAAGRTFGFRGEALASISDVSLLEIITKAYGRPNGYRKVMKGSKCLYLGIDDDRKDVGTIVVARDLFYNQPVRRKYMQSSPKKVLHSVKKCLLRIALVHTKVSFKIVDIESEDELLSTHSSSSPLSLLMSGFGIEDSSFLHELKANDGVLRISGYISGPCDSFSIKAFQYVYINSRFVCKGPIHKVLNHLAASFDYLDSCKSNLESQKGKRSRSQVCPAYIVNLHCPRSLYDLTFELSKTYVVFKDWETVLNFIKKAIHTVWIKAYGESFSHTAYKIGKDEMSKKHDSMISTEGDLLEDAELALESSRFRNHQASLHLPCSPLEKLTNEGSHMFHGEHERITFWEFQHDTAELEEENMEMEFVCQANHSFRSSDAFAKCLTTVPQKIDNHLWISDNNSSSKESYFLDHSFSGAGRSGTSLEGDFSNPQWGKKYLKIEPGVSNGLSGSTLSFDRDEFRNEVEISKDVKKPFLQSWSSKGSLPFDGVFSSDEEGFDLPTDSFKNKRKRACCDEKDDIQEVDASNQSFDLYSRTLLHDNGSCAQNFPRDVTKGDMSTGFDLLSRASLKSPPLYPFTEEAIFLSDSNRVRNSGSVSQSLDSEWCSVISEPICQVASWDVKHFINKNSLEGTNYRQLEDIKEKCKFSYDALLKRSNQEKCTSICRSTVLDFEDFDLSSKSFYKVHQEHNLPNKFSPEHSDMLIDRTDWLCSISCGKDFGKYESRRKQFRDQNFDPNPDSKKRSRRSHSAPPFHRYKRKFITLTQCSIMQAGKSDAHTFHHVNTSPEAGVLEHLQQPSGVCHLNFTSGSVNDLVFGTRPDIMKKSDTTLDMKTTQDGENFRQPQYPQAHVAARVEDFISKEIQDPIDSGTKWRTSCPQATNNIISYDFHHQDSILDISSALLHLAADSLVPESISKNCLKDAKVLQQVDKKFIPVVAGGILAFIDQHAADERIRLEELRHKVLSGEGKTVSYLDSEQELILPEIGYQLLHNYAEQMTDWGWICNIHTEGSRSFKKDLTLLHQQPTIVTLLAVPCILGVNLSDVDLLEFLQQLADTDGSSTIPPSVLRVLNSKACRGAIMFGDTLLPSECSLIVEELEQTSLCFQCAHGRPTTVPLVNLEALHKQIAQLGILNDNSSESWHGLRRHETSLERSSQRLHAARE